MADEVLIAQFRADVAGLKKQLDDYVVSLEKVQKEEKDTQKETTKTVETNKSAAQKRNQAIKAELVELNKLEAARKKAFTPEAINAFNKKIDETKKNISQLRGVTESTTSGIKNSLAGIAGGFAAAFSVQQVVNFGKVAVNAFLEAEENAKRLEFAVTQIAGESEVAFERLIRQSQQLQDVSIFSDDSIQQAQTALATFGLLSDQIEALTPKILDFASATKTDVPNATDTFIRALEGQTRGLVTAGLKFEDTGTIIGNYNKLLESTEKLTGATTEATESLTGQLKQMENQADELQESIGSRLAQSFVEWRYAALKLFETLIEGFDSLESKQLKADANQRELIRQAIEANIAGDAILSGLTVEAEAKNKLIEVGRELNKLDEQRVEAQKRWSEEQAKLFNLPEREQALKRVQDLEAERKKMVQTAAILTDIVKLEEGRRVNKVAELKADELRLEKIQTLNELLKENQNRSDIISKSNVDLINKEIEARKKAQDIRVAGIDDEVKKLKTLEASLDDLKKLEDIIIQFSIIADEDTEENIQEKIDFLRERFKNNKLEVPVEVDPDNAFETSREKFERFKSELESKGVSVKLTLEGVDLPTLQARVAEASKALNEELEKQKTVVLRPEVDIGPAITGLEEASLTISQIWLKENQEILDGTRQMIGQVIDLYKQVTDAKIDAIQIESDKQMNALDAQEDAIESNLDKRRISEREAEKQREELLQQRTKAEAEAQKKINDIKRKQFNIDKIAALAEIAIETAIKATEAPIPLKPYYIAFGAAQAAIVAANPNPYKKGTKSAKKGLALVDEEGTEAMFSPRKGRLTMLDGKEKIIPAQKSRKYEKVFDAIYDGKFEDFIFKTEIAPILIKQKTDFQKQEKQSLAENITKSMVINNMTNGKGDFYLEKMSKRGMPIANLNELAEILISNRQSHKR